jgi:hypothetical protein
MAHRYQYHPDAAGVRESGASRPAESDPLAELARLIGQSDPTSANFSSRATPLPQGHGRHQDRHQDDRYQDQYQDQQPEPVAAEPAPPSWMRSAASSGWQQPQAPNVHPAAQQQEHYPDPADEQAQQYQEQEYDDRPAFLRTARQHDQSRYDDVLYDQNSQNEPQQQYADGQYQENYQDQADPNGYPPFYADAAQDEPKRSRGGLMTVVAVLALAVVGTAAAYGYRSFAGSPRSGEPPVIKAEPGGNKIVPPTQTSDASGKIVDRIGGSANGPERVLSREEQPLDINGRNSPRVVFPPLNQSGNAPSAFPAPQAAPPAPQQVASNAAPSNGALGDEPRRVRTTTIRPDQPDTVPSGTAPAQRPTQARAQVPAPSGSAPMSLSPQQGGSAAPVRTASAPAAAAAPSNGSGGYMVQISSQRSEADAQASYRAMQSKFPNVLGSRSASIRRADLGEKGIYYRALVGPFAAAEDAGQLCSSLRSAGGQCVVQRN